MSPVKWHHVALAAGGAIGLTGLIYYLTREESAKVTMRSESKNEKLDVRKATEAQVLRILERIIQSQEKMKVVLKDLTRELVASPASLEDVYQKVKGVQPEDPLEAVGLTMAEFDQLLEKFQTDPNIKEAIGKIMGAPGPVGFSPKVNTIKCDKIVEVHEYMMNEFKNIVEEFNKLPNRNEWDLKTVTVAAQAIVGAKVEAQYGLTPEELESAVLLHHQSLACDSEFSRINVQMQSTMSELMGSQFPSTLF